MLVVKKYSNRRLYDTEESRYVTLDELAGKVRDGADVRVVDAKTAEDLTQPTLAQIILESRNGARLLPVPLLVQLIRMREDALAEFLGRWLSTSLELYLQAKQGAQALTPINPFATLPFTATNALTRLLMGALPWTEPGPPAPASPPSAGAPTAIGNEVADLRRELDALKASLKRPPRRR
jgi:polyhydroxyalkanoate synthesis repressor PhaR